MDPTERVYAEANVTRFSDMLYSETAAPMRARLQELLLAEDNRFASRSLRLEMAERFIAEARARIDKQMRKVAELCASGHDVDRLCRTLGYSFSVLEAFETFRAMVSDSLDRAEL